MRLFRMDRAALLLRQEPPGQCGGRWRAGWDTTAPASFPPAFKEAKGKSPLEFRREAMVNSSTKRDNAAPAERKENPISLIIVVVRER